MLTLAFVFFLLLFLFSIATAVARASRRRRQLRELALRQEQQEHGLGSSPFAGMPFGSMLEQMMRGGGGWTARSSTTRAPANGWT